MISWVANDRAVEKRRASDAAYREQTGGKVLRSSANPLGDDELLAKLRSFDIHLDRPSLGRLCETALSAEEIALPLLDQRAAHGIQEEMESDWIWVCLCELWKRWFPDQPSFELLDDKMQAGYSLRGNGDAPAVCRIWLDAWRDVLGLFEKGGMQTIDEFDERFAGTECVFNWIRDLEDELRTAGAQDPEFLRERIAVCEERLRRFGSAGGLTNENRRRALAESYFELGETNKAEALYREWLAADPQWGGGWIGWSDCYHFAPDEIKDLNRAAEILQKGLSIEEVRDRADLLDRLADVRSEQGRNEEAKDLLREAKRTAERTRATRSIHAAGNVLRQTTRFKFEGEGLPLDRLPELAAGLRMDPVPAAAKAHKTGRNEPCPCGSGKKFKKCCGA